MDVNPYQAPTISEPALADEPPPGERPPRRPPGIVFLAGLHLVVGLLLVLGTVLIFRMFYRENPTVVPLWFLVGMCGFMAALGLGSSIGLWRGHRWGWWLTVFYYVWSSIGLIAEVVFTLANGEELSGLGSKLIQFAVSALILLYLFKRNVRAFFGLQLQPALLSLIPLAILAICLLFATSLVTYFQLGVQGE